MNGLFLLGGSEAFLFWMEGKKKMWSWRVSIPLPSACKADALPFELQPLRVEIALHVKSFHCINIPVHSCAHEIPEKMRMSIAGPFLEVISPRK